MRQTSDLTEMADFFLANPGRVALPGGRSVVPLLEELKTRKVDWSRFNFYLTDERVQKEHSNFEYLEELFFSKIDIPRHNLHKVDLSNPKTYFSGVYDLVVLGVGEDGHIASLFPNTSVKEDQERYFAIDNSPKPPPKRITMPRKMVETAKAVVVLFVGEQKQEAFKAFNNPEVDYVHCPAKIAKIVPRLLVGVIL